MTRREEKILKKAIEIMNQGEFGSLSDYEVTTHVALETAQWADKTMIEKAVEWLNNFYQYKLGYKPFEEVVEDFKRAMEE